MCQYGPCTRMTRTALKHLADFRFYFQRFSSCPIIHMQNAWIREGPVDQAKRARLHSVVSHGSGATALQLLTFAESHRSLRSRVSLLTSVAVLGLHLRRFLLPGHAFNLAIWLRASGHWFAYKLVVLGAGDFHFSCW